MKLAKSVNKCAASVAIAKLFAKIPPKEIRGEKLQFLNQKIFNYQISTNVMKQTKKKQSVQKT